MADFITDALVIGAGQSGLAVGYYLRRAGDENPTAGLICEADMWCR